MFPARKVGSFPFPENPIVEVLATESVDSAFKKLVDHKILSAPCWDEENQKYLGFFDITDALALIYSVDLLVRAIPDALLERTTALRMAASGTACKDCADLVVGSLFQGEGGQCNDRDHSWNPITDDAPMSQVIFLLATSTRRVPVIDPETKRVTKILSQSLITQVIHEALKAKEAQGDTLPDLFNKTLRNSGGFGVRPVLSVDAEANITSDAFHMIIENGVSAVTVLSEGKILSSITTKDIRLFGSTEEAALQRLAAEQTKRDVNAGRDLEAEQNPKEHLALMDLTCGDFVSMVEQTAASSRSTRAPAVVVNMDMTIRKIIARMAVTKKHRVFVVDENRVPIGVISVSDIAKLLVTDPNKKE